MCINSPFSVHRWWSGHISVNLIECESRWSSLLWFGPIILRLYYYLIQSYFDGGWWSQIPLWLWSRIARMAKSSIRWKFDLRPNCHDKSFMCTQTTAFHTDWLMDWSGRSLMASGITGKVQPNNAYIYWRRWKRWAECQDCQSNTQFAWPDLRSKVNHVSLYHRLLVSVRIPFSYYLVPIRWPQDKRFFSI